MSSICVKKIKFKIGLRGDWTEEIKMDLDYESNI